jgi:hypothetical protein
VNFHSDLDPVTKAPIDISFHASDFRMLEPGTSISKLAVKTRAAEIYTQIDRFYDRNYQQEDPKDPNALKDQIAKLSVKYQVVTAEVAVVAVVKQEKKVVQEAKPVPIHIPTEEDMRKAAIKL